MSDATSGFGTLFQIADSGGTVYTSVAEVVTVGGPNLTLDMLEVTHHASPGGYKEFVAGLLDAGEVTLGLNHLPANATQSNATDGLVKLLDSKAKRNMKIIFPDSGSTTWTLVGFITSLSPSDPVDGKAELNCTIKITGQPTLA